VAPPPAQMKLISAPAVPWPNEALGVQFCPDLRACDKFQNNKRRWGIG
jgi:hypothetical protein